MSNKYLRILFFTLGFLPAALLGQNISINTTGAANSSLSMLEILQISATANSKGLYILHSGTPIAGTGYGVWSEITGANTTNIAGYFSTSNATFNYALIVPSGGGIVGINTSAPTSTYLMTINPNTNAVRSGIDMTLTNASSAATGINISTGNSFVNGITVTSSASANATYYGVGGLLTSGVLTAANTFAKGYLGYKANSGTNVAANYFAGYFQGKVAVTSNISPDGIADLEIQNTTTGAGNPATVFLRQTTSNTTNTTVLNNLNFGDNHSTSPQAQIQVIRGAAGGAGDLPTDMLFYTTPDASSSIAERMRITNSGKIGINMYPSMLLDVTWNTTTADDAVIRGAATGNARVYGVLGTTTSTTLNSSGIRGYASGTTGATNGVWGESASTSNNAAGVYGLASGVTSTAFTYGVFGKTVSTYATSSGVYGEATGGGTNSTYGVNGFSNSSVGIGVYGVASGSSGTGVWGNASNGTGTTYGIFGSVNSASGYSGYFSGGQGVYVDAKVGIGTGGTMNTRLDVNGDLALRGGSPLVLVNGANNDVSIAGLSYYSISGPTAGFSINGFTGGQNGKILIIYNSTSQNMTINHNSGTAPANGIITNTGAAVTTTGVGMATFIYDSTAQRWILISWNP